MNDWQTCVGVCQPIKTRTIFTWFLWLYKMSVEGPVWSMRNLKPFEGRGIFYAKLLNERLVRAKGGIFIDIPFCADLYISPLFSFRLWCLKDQDTSGNSAWVPLHYVGHIPYCKLALLSLTCEGTSWPTFWSLPTRVGQLKFVVWRPLYQSIIQLYNQPRSQGLSSYRPLRPQGAVRWETLGMGLLYNDISRCKALF